jgi:hypothetical protein
MLSLQSGSKLPEFALLHAVFKSLEWSSILLSYPKRFFLLADKGNFN